MKAALLPVCATAEAPHEAPWTSRCGYKAGTRSRVSKVAKSRSRRGASPRVWVDAECLAASHGTARRVWKHSWRPAAWCLVAAGGGAQIPRVRVRESTVRLIRVIQNFQACLEGSMFRIPMRIPTALYSPRELDTCTLALFRGSTNHYLSLYRIVYFVTAL